MKKILVMMLPPLLAGCGMFADDGLFRDRSKDYLSAREYPVIRVPEGLDDRALGQLYVIPEVSEPLLAEQPRSVPRPQPLGTSLLEEDIKVQSLGDRRWVWINRGPAEVWPRVRNLLNANNIITDHSDAAAGVIETAWVEFEDDPGYRHRYRLQIEEGMQRDTSEISATHEVALLEGGASDRQRDAEQRRTKEMLDFVASGLAGGDTLGLVSLLAQSIGGGAKVEMVAAAEETPYLLIKLGYDRSWASVAYSVSREDFQLVDQDRSRGLFYINLKKELAEERPGFFARILGAGDAEAASEPVTARYRVQLEETQQGVLVRVESENAEVERDRKLEVLQRIRANLA